MIESERQAETYILTESELGYGRERKRWRESEKEIRKGDHGIISSVFKRCIFRAYLTWCRG